MVQVDGRHDGHGGVRDAGGVPRAAEADLDDGDVDGGLRERLVGEPDHDLEERHADAVDAVGVHHLDQGQHVADELGEPLAGDGLPVDADAFGEVLEVGAGEPAHAQAEGEQELFDHDGRAALAVGAGDLDDGVPALRRAQQVGEGADAREAGADAMLGPPGLQFGDDVGVRLHGGVSVACRPRWPRRLPDAATTLAP